jgi:hypothetical protein
LIFFLNNNNNFKTKSNKERKSENSRKREIEREEDVIAWERSTSAIGGKAIRSSGDCSTRPSDRLLRFHRRDIRRRRRYVQGLSLIIDLSLFSLFMDLTNNLRFVALINLIIIFFSLAKLV